MPWAGAVLGAILAMYVWHAIVSYRTGLIPTDTKTYFDGLPVCWLVGGALGFAGGWAIDRRLTRP